MSDFDCECDLQLGDWECQRCNWLEEIETLTAKVEELNEEVGKTLNRLQAAHKEVAALTADRDKYKEALEVYGNKDNWITSEYKSAFEDPDHSKIDGYELAQQALKTEEETNDK